MMKILFTRSNSFVATEFPHSNLSNELDIQPYAGIKLNESSDQEKSESEFKRRIIMKVKKLFAVFFVVILSVFTVLANTPDKIAFTGTDYFDPFNILGNGVVGALLDPGTVQCPGHKPTVDPMQPCPPGSNIHLRNTQVETLVTSSDPRFSGRMFIESNSNFAPDFTGPQWGRFRLVFNVGGEMNGTWQGVRYKEGNSWIVPLHATGHITGGAFDGANVLIKERATGYTPIPVAWVGAVEATLTNVP
jgi:hypothetical protein